MTWSRKMRFSKTQRLRMIRSSKMRSGERAMRSGKTRISAFTLKEKILIIVVYSMNFILIFNE